MRVPQIAIEVNKIIKPAYLVGGPIRSLILGNKPHDFDFCTPIKPDDIEAAVKNAGRRAFTVGKKFGTIGFKVKGSWGKWQMVEVTTFREEDYEPGNRKPNVKFVNDLEQDLSRRDFTMNAIALGSDGKVIDPFDGQKDIRDKIIRGVGFPRRRFKEDPLRMLRAARFVAKLGFEIEESTEKAIKDSPWSILSISKERWMIEMDKMLSTDKPSIGMEVLARTRLLNFMFPELALQIGYDQNSRYHNLTLWEHTMKVLDIVPKNKLNLRWAALFHDIGKVFVRTNKPTKWKVGDLASIPGAAYEYFRKPSKITEIDGEKVWLDVPDENYVDIKDLSPATKSNYIRHEKLSHEIVQKYASYLKWSNTRRDKVSWIVKKHLEDDCKLRKYDNYGKEGK